MISPQAPHLAGDEDDEVKIIAADTSLLRKFGKENLDKVMSASAIIKAEKVITDASDELYTDCVKEISDLHEIISQFKIDSQETQKIMQQIIAKAFSIKTKSGQAGYNLVAALAKSLHLYCEEMMSASITTALLNIIDWHERSIKQILSTKIKGDGGLVGKAIMDEIEKLGIKKNL